MLQNLIERDVSGAGEMTSGKLVARMTPKDALMLLALILAVTSCESPTVTDVGFTIEGHVYARLTSNPSDPNGPGLYVDPLSGAVVSTSLDSQTAITDANGHFVLTTSKRPAANCTPYTVRVTASGHPTYSLAGSWGVGARNQIFSLSPPNPEKVDC